MIEMTGGYHPGFTEEKWALKISEADTSQTAHHENS